MRARCAPLGPGGNKKDTQEFQRTESHTPHYPTCLIYNERIWRKNIYISASRIKAALYSVAWMNAAKFHGNRIIYIRFIYTAVETDTYIQFSYANQKVYIRRPVILSATFCFIYIASKGLWSVNFHLKKKKEMRTDNHIEIKYGDDVVLLLYCRENIFDVHIQTKYFYMTSFSSWCT